MSVTGFLVNNTVQKYNYESLENYNTPDFSTSSTYQVGDYVMYQGKLYKCTTTITTSGAWDSTKWSLAILSDDVTDLKSAIDGKQDAPSDAGIAGQVLGLDDDLNPVWLNQGGGGGGTTNYNNLTNKPSINGVLLSGNKSAEDFGLAKTSDIPDKTSELTNDSGFVNAAVVPQLAPVQSVNGAVGKIMVQPTITAKGILKGNSYGSVGKATKGTDYGALTFTVTLAAAGWNNNTQTISNANFVTSDYGYIVSPASSSFADYASAQIYADDVTVAGQMTFHYMTAPSAALTVNIIRVVSA